MVATAQLEQARAALDVARKHLRDTVIKSPVAGEIQRKFVNKGAYVEAPTRGVHGGGQPPPGARKPGGLGRPRAHPVRASASPSRVNSYPGVKFEGRVIEIAPAVDAETRSAKVRIQVDNAGGKLKAGMFAQGEILTGVQRARPS